MAMTRRGGLTIAAIIGVAGFFGLRLAAQNGLIPGKLVGVSVVPKKVNLPTTSDAPVAKSSATFALPSAAPANLSTPVINYEIWAWGAQKGKMLAHGGAPTDRKGVFQPAQGSLLAQAGVNVHFKRQDDPVKMQEDLVTFATALKNGERNPTVGTHFVAIMGDGAAAFLEGINPVLEAKLGPEYTAKVIGSGGYSRGEDRFMGPAEWKTNPEKARGGVVVGYLRDGDWNIALKWLGDNSSYNIPNNPDETTYDPNALNWIAAENYVDAAQKYISGYTEERVVVKNGRKTTDTKKVGVDAVVTWTPGDVNIARNKGGLVSILSTKENKYQMPNTIIGIDLWMKNNKSTVVKMLDAFLKGGELVRTHPEALDYSCEIAARVFNEGDARYWKRYHNVVIEPDVQGIEVELGGSYVNTLSDNLHLYGMLPGSMNLFAATYETFGNIVVEQYPNLVSKYPPTSAILDLSYLRELQMQAGKEQEVFVDLPKYNTSTPIKETLSKADWQVEFALGSDQLTSLGRSEVQKLSQNVAITDATVIIHGHTDDQGDPDNNLLLSRRRALTVKGTLEAYSATNFPEGRIRVVPHGEDELLSRQNGESTQAWQARCRRVVVQLAK